MQALAAQEVDTTPVNQINQEKEQEEQMETDSQENEDNRNQLNVANYSDRSFVVYGDLTRKYKDNLKNLGGRFNKNLTLNGKKAMGWVFGRKNEEKVMAFVLSVNDGSANAFSNNVPTTQDIGLPTVNAPSNSTNASYQFVKFRVYRPRENQNVKLTTSGKTMKGVVTKIESHNHDGVIDTVYIDFDGQTSMAAICRSKWQIFGYQTEHNVFFTD